MKEKIKELSIEEKIGQMLMIGLDIANPKDKIEEIITKYKIGGVLLYKKNYKTYEELIDLINYIKKKNEANKIPLFIAIDQEGGRVNRMPPEFKNIPAATKLARCKDESIVEKAGEITGEMLSKLGINFDFAPVLDIKRFEDKHPIGDRAFSEDKEAVARCGISYMKALQKNNVIATIKHFPGHGATEKDSHFILPIVKENIEKLEQEDMMPFQKAIEAGADSLLVSHLKIKGVTEYPCSMSREFITYIRKKYKYKGLIVTDDMRMKGVELLYGKNKSIQKAFYAGNDIIVIKYGRNENIINKIIEEVKQDKRKEARVNRSVKRILEEKEKYNCNNDQVEKQEGFVEKINEQIHNIKQTIELTYKYND